MREIKFRAWDTITNKMHNSIEELYFENGVLIEVIFKKSWDGIGSCAEEIVEWQNADQTILMQYTGLKDKNGVEVYESDIVEYRGKRGVVFMRLGCWFVEFQRELGYYNHSVIVVGNIHELESHT